MHVRASTGVRGQTQEGAEGTLLVSKCSKLKGGGGQEGTCTTIVRRRWWCVHAVRGLMEISAQDSILD